MKVILLAFNEYEFHTDVSILSLLFTILLSAEELNVDENQLDSGR